MLVVTRDAEAASIAHAAGALVIDDHEMPARAQRWRRCTHLRLVRGFSSFRPTCRSSSRRLSSASLGEGEAPAVSGAASADGGPCPRLLPPERCHLFGEEDSRSEPCRAGAAASNPKSCASRARQEIERPEDVRLCRVLRIRDSRYLRRGLSLRAPQGRHPGIPAAFVRHGMLPSRRSAMQTKSRDPRTTCRCDLDPDAAPAAKRDVAHGSVGL